MNITLKENVLKNLYDSAPLGVKNEVIRQKPEKIAREFFSRYDLVESAKTADTRQFILFEKPQGVMGRIAYFFQKMFGIKRVLEKDEALQLYEKMQTELLKAQSEEGMRSVDTLLTYLEIRYEGLPHHEKVGIVAQKVLIDEGNAEKKSVPIQGTEEGLREATSAVLTKPTKLKTNVQDLKSRLGAGISKGLMRQMAGTRRAAPQHETIMDAGAAKPPKIQPVTDNPSEGSGAPLTGLKAQESSSGKVQPQLLAPRQLPPLPTKPPVVLPKASPSASSSPSVKDLKTQLGQTISGALQRQMEGEKGLEPIQESTEGEAKHSDTKAVPEKERPPGSVKMPGGFYRAKGPARRKPPSTKS